METTKLKKHERVELALRSLYDGYGYSRFRMSNFEEYSFYLENKSFLQSERVITFNDLDGRLMALKPDVTLSIVKNAKCGDKFYYTENVYRPSAHNFCYKEIKQVGLEALGNVDLYTECEVALLAARSLAEIDERFVLDVSHMGLINLLCERIGGDRGTLIRLLQSKNEHEAELIFGKDALLNAVIRCDLDEIDALCGLDVAPVTAEIRSIIEFLAENGVVANLDFSLINDDTYYNGVIFRGYVERIPHPVLSGGRYDKLLQKLDKGFAGLGFAVYLDELDVYDGRTENGFDVLVYSDGDDPKQVKAAADALRSQGKAVRAVRSLDGVKYKDAYVLTNGRAEVYNA